MNTETAPSSREPKPEWSKIPELLREISATLLGSQIIGAQTVWGGYTPSATFCLKLGDAREIFMKCSHAELGEIGANAFSAEVENFQREPGLVNFAPRFLGRTEVGEWRAMFFDFISDRESIPPWSQTRVRQLTEWMARLHAVDDWRGLELAHASQFHSELMKGTEGWSVLQRSGEDRAALAALLARKFDLTPGGAEKWLVQHVDHFAECELEIAALRENFSGVHMDLRSDNMLFSRSRGLLLADWPYFVFGPRILDLAFLVPSVEAEGGPRAEELIALYESACGIKFSGRERLAAAALSAGYFASRAFLEDIPALPRVRWVQRQQLWPALRWLCAELKVSAPN